MMSKSTDTGQAILGIDIAKASLTVALLWAGQRHEGYFVNEPAGFAALQAWLEGHEAGQVHACLEATGRYGYPVATFLHGRGHAVSVVNPAQVKAFGQSKLQRVKNDRLDARLIADFCRSHCPLLWQPPAAAQAELRELVRRLDDLQQMHQQEANRLQAGQTSARVVADLRLALASLKARIKALDKAIRTHIDAHPSLDHACRLLTSIPGLGLLTAARLLAEIPDIRAFKNAKQLATFIGLTPSEYSSGTSVYRRPSITHKGNSTLRHHLYWPAISAIRCNPRVAQLAARLREKGKPGLVVIVAAMHKLVSLAFGVLKSNLPFDPAYALAATMTS